MTAYDIINRALRLAAIIAAGETPSGDVSQDALTTLNDLLAEWRGSDIFVPDHSVAALATTLTLSPADKEAVAYQLALRISPEYGQSVSPEFSRVMDESFNRLRLRYFQPGTTDFSELPRPNRPWDWVNG
jgi:hypothetical protein